AELAEWQLALLGVGEVRFRPFPYGDLRRRRTRRRSAAATSGVARCAAATRWRRRAYPDVALRACVRAARPQRFDWIHDERQRFEFDVDRFHGLGGFELARRGNRENRLALIERLVRQPAFGLGGGLDVLAERRAGGRARHVVCRENRLHPRYRQRLARVEPLDARVGHRAREQLAEEHAVHPIILGVLRLAGDFRDEVGRRVV